MAGATIKETPENTPATENEYYKRLRRDQEQSRGAVYVLRCNKRE
jgi:hypothetical protein